MNYSFNNQGRNTAKVGLSLCAASILFASGCSTIVNWGRYSAANARDDSTMERRVDPWVWGNAAFAVFPPVAIVGLGIDAFSGNWYRYTDSVTPPASAPLPSAQPPFGHPPARQPQEPQPENPDPKPDLLDSILNK